MRKLAISTSSTPPHTTTGEILKVKRTRKSIPRNFPMQRSSVYRGVTRHRWTGRFEAHLWDKSCWSESQKKKGKQVYLGAYDDEGAAAKAYDLAALKYWGRETILNFPLPNYENELKEMEGQSKEEYISSIRRKSSGFSRGISKYRGVARHHHNGRWEARIGRVLGNKYLYLGTYATQEEAAVAYDMAAIEHRGLNAITNFDVSRYLKYLQHSDYSDQESKANSQIANQMPQDEDTNKINTLLQQEWCGAQWPVYSIASYSHARTEQGQVVPSEFGITVDQSSKFGHEQEKISYWDDDRPSPPELSPMGDHLQSFCSFPDDIQTCFHSAVHENYTYADDIISGDLEAISNADFEFEQVCPYILEFD